MIRQGSYLKGSINSGREIPSDQSLDSHYNNHDQIRSNDYNHNSEFTGISFDYLSKRGPNQMIETNFSNQESLAERLILDDNPNSS